MLNLQERFKALKKEYGSASLGEVLVEQAIGGMRGIPVILLFLKLSPCLLLRSTILA